MKIAAIISTWNEEKILPFTLDHYSSFCDRLIAIDNESTDGTVDLLNKFNVTQYTVRTDGKHDEVRLTSIRNYIYTLYRDFDWVIMADADEIVGPRNTIRKALEYYKDQKIDVPRIQGYEVIAPKDFLWSNSFDQSFKEFTKFGLWSKSLCKNIVFNPNIEMHFGLGKHECKHNGKEDGDSSMLYLKQYKFMGERYVIDKHTALSTRVEHNTDICSHWRDLAVDPYKGFVPLLNNNLLLELPL